VKRDDARIVVPARENDSVLPYAVPSTGARPIPSATKAILLTLPGLICWAILLGQIGRFWMRPIFRYRVNEERLAIVGGIVWLIAIPTALYCVFHYFPKRKTIYVVICLIVNIVGLLFTAVVLVCLLIAVNND
jgi:hypothetical protein